MTDRTFCNYRNGTDESFKDSMRKGIDRNRWIIMRFWMRTSRSFSDLLNLQWDIFVHASMVGYKSKNLYGSLLARLIAAKPQRIVIVVKIRTTNNRFEAPRVRSENKFAECHSTLNNPPVLRAMRNFQISDPETKSFWSSAAINVVALIFCVVYRKNAGLVKSRKNETRRCSYWPGRLFFPRRLLSFSVVLLPWGDKAGFNPKRGNGYGYLSCSVFKNNYQFIQAQYKWMIFIPWSRSPSLVDLRIIFSVVSNDQHRDQVMQNKTVFVWWRAPLWRCHV